MRSLATFSFLEMIFLRFSTVSLRSTARSNWPPVVGVMHTVISSLSSAVAAATQPHPGCGVGGSCGSGCGVVVIVVVGQEVVTTAAVAAAAARGPGDADLIEPRSRHSTGSTAVSPVVGAPGAEAALASSSSSSTTVRVFGMVASSLSLPIADATSDVRGEPAVSSILPRCPRRDCRRPSGTARATVTRSV